jgi:hypothetical protein
VLKSRRCSFCRTPLSKNGVRDSTVRKEEPPADRCAFGPQATQLYGGVGSRQPSYVDWPLTSLGQARRVLMERSGPLTRTALAPLFSCSSFGTAYPLFQAFAQQRIRDLGLRNSEISELRDSRVEWPPASTGRRSCFLLSPEPPCMRGQALAVALPMRSAPAPWAVLPSLSLKPFAARNACLPKRRGFRFLGLRGLSSQL